MKITDAKIIVGSLGRNFVTLKVFTDQGVYGLGDATLNGHAAVVDEAAAAKVPYRAASLPVARKTDGTAFHC